MYNKRLEKLMKDIEDLQFKVLSDDDLTLREDINLTLREAWYYVKVAGQLIDADICLG